jgi:ribosomal subunit interface protein
LRVQITERHCDVPPDVEKRTLEQVEALSKYEDRATSADVVYEEVKLTRRVEVIVHIDGADPVIAHGEGAEFRKALDQVIGRLGRMLRKQRERRRDHQAPPLAERITND